MICRTCKVELINDCQYMVCPNCGVIDPNYLMLSNEIDFEHTHLFHPVVYIRQEYFIKILFELHFAIEEMAIYLQLFKIYTKAFDFIKPRKYLLSRKFVMNEFNKLLGKPIIFNKPLKTYKSLRKVKKIWASLTNTQFFETCPSLQV